MEKAILEVKKTIEDQVKYGDTCFNGLPFSRYQKFYYCTNENIKAYLDLVEFTNKERALSVMASGDHIYNLITKGILDIDTFDTNELTEFYALGLRRAIILKYNYQEYLNLMNNFLRNEDVSLNDLSDFLNGLLQFMDGKHRCFFG